MTWRAKGEATKSPREQRFVARMTGIQVAVMTAAFALCLMTLYGRGIRILTSPLVHDLEISAAIFFLWAGFELQFFQHRRQLQIRHEDKTFDETEWRLRRAGLGKYSNTGSAPSYWLSLKLSALPFVFFAIFAFHVPGRRSALNLGLQVGVLLLVTFFPVFMLRRGGYRRRRVREPHLGFTVGLSIALTFFVIGMDLFKTRSGGVVSIREIVLLSAAVVPAYALATGIFLWKGRSIPHCD